MSGIDPEAQDVVDQAFPTLDAMFSAGEQVEGLLVHPGWDALSEALRAELAAEERRLSRGRRPLDQADYALAHGRLGALQLALELPDAIVGRARERREEQAARHEAPADA